jgi:phosphoribosylaminoimidazolecarboxamide formyltransferase/IMP cyclohydrolase
VAHARQLHGKALSFNNLHDADGALELVKEVASDESACAAVIKHANACGLAVVDEGEHPLADAFERAWNGDPLAAFGGIVAFNRTVDEATAERLAEGERFIEVLVAPDHTQEAQRILTQRFAQTRILATGPLPAPARRDARELAHKRLTGGLLAQQRDLAPVLPAGWRHVAGPAPDAALAREMTVAMIAAKHLKSNAVALAAEGALVGAGPGQVDRVASCRQAVAKAGERARGAVAGSDAFFPFRDGPDVLIQAGVRAIVQPGGSKRDEETIQA